MQSCSKQQGLPTCGQDRAASRVRSALCSFVEKRANRKGCKKNSKLGNTRRALQENLFSVPKWDGTGLNLVKQARSLGNHAEKTPLVAFQLYVVHVF